MECLFNVEVLASLATLIVLEIVLGIDNIIFIAVLSGRLPKEQQARAQRFGSCQQTLSASVYRLDYWPHRPCFFANGAGVFLA